MEKVTCRTRRTPLISVLFLGVLAAGGCAVFNPPTFTQQQLAGTDPTLTYGAMLSNYRDQEGEKVILGGRIVHLENRTSKAFIQVEPAPLDRQFRPRTPDATSELFLLIFPYPVDPSALRDGQKITVIGRLRRMRRPTLTESGKTLRLVTIDVLTLHTWVPATALMGPSPFPAMTPGYRGPYQVP